MIALKSGYTRQPLTIGTARSSLAWMWILTLTPLVLIITVQCLIGHYGNDWQVPFSWMATFIFPIWGIMASALTVGAPRAHRAVVRSRSTYHFTRFISILYIVILYSVLFAGQFNPSGITNVMTQTTLFFVSLQSLVTVFIGKFFIESVEDEQPDRDNNAHKADNSQPSTTP